MPGGTPREPARSLRLIAAGQERSLIQVGTGLPAVPRPWLVAHCSGLIHWSVWPEGVDGWTLPVPAQALAARQAICPGPRPQVGEMKLQPDPQSCPVSPGGTSSPWQRRPITALPSLLQTLPVPREPLFMGTGDWTKTCGPGRKQKPLHGLTCPLSHPHEGPLRGVGALV